MCVKMQKMAKKEKKVSFAKVAALAKVSRASAKKYAAGRQIKAKKRQVSAKVKQRARALRKIALQTMKKDDRIFPKFGSAAAICEELHKRTGERVSVRTVQRDLRSKCSLRSYVRRTVPSRNRNEVEAKQKFLRSLKGKPASFFRRLVFSDETWVSTVERTSRRQYCADKSKVLPKERKTRWNYAAFQVFATVGVGWRSPLTMFPVDVTDEEGERRPFRLNAERYVRSCLSPIVDELVRKNRILQQDGAKSHSARRTAAYLKRKHVQILNDFPAYAPDLNAIETVWKVLHERIGKRCPTTMEELRTVAVEEWNAIDQRQIDKICLHFQHQVEKA